MQKSPFQLAWQRLLRNRVAVVGALLLTAIALGCVFLPLLLKLDPNVTQPALHHQPPSARFLFGTDTLGRDVFARVLVGGRTSLLVGIAATAVSILVGVSYGAVAGFYGGKIDEAMMRLVDFLYGLPYMFLVILIMLMFSETARGDMLPVFLALGLVQWLTMARIVRGQTLSIRQREFIEAAVASGAGTARIIVKHVIPNVIGPVVVYATLTVPQIIMFESFLSFLGLGIQEPHASLGALIAEGAGEMEAAPWMLLVPGGLLALLLLALNIFGDGLRDALDVKER
jgi:oligopeptide transport system permease protein